MLPESKNIQMIADNIRSLENQINALDVEIPSHAAADAGKILAVDSEGNLEWKTEYSYTPPAYSSTEEVNTGQKWIDGKYIYMKTYSATFPIITSTGIQNIDTEFSVDNIIDSSVIINTGTIIYVNNFPIYYNVSTTTLYLANVGTTFSEKDYFINVYYTKPDPAPETKSKKGGNKK